MPDNVTYQSSTLATPASGTKVSADEDVTNGMVQRIKLAASADGSSVHVGADANGLQVQGAAADDAAAAGNPVEIGGLAKAYDGTDPGSVAEGDAASLITDLNRRLLVNTSHPNWFNANENHATAQTNNELVAAPGASLSLYVTTLIISCEVAMNVKLVEDTGGTPADIAGPYYFASLGGMTVKFDPPIQVTANTNLGFTSSAAGNHSITVTGFTAP